MVLNRKLTAARVANARQRGRHRLIAEIQYQTNGYTILYKSPDGYQIAVLDVDIRLGRISFTESIKPTPDDSVNARAYNWETRWNNCMRRRINDLLDNPVDLAFFIIGSGGPAGVVVGWAGMNAGCAYEATFG